MPKLRDYFFSDLNTFINTDEFAEEVKIDGDTVDVVIDTDQLKELKLTSGGEGLAKCELLFHVKVEDMPFTPFVGQDIEFNNKYYIIAVVNEDHGLYTIALEVPKA